MSAIEKDKTIKDSVLFKQFSKIAPLAIRSINNPQNLEFASQVVSQIEDIIFTEECDQIEKEITKLSREYYEFAELMYGIKHFYIWETLNKSNLATDIIVIKTKKHFNNFLISQKSE